MIEILRYLYSMLSQLIAVLSLLLASMRRTAALRGDARAVVRQVTNRQILFTGIDAIPLIALIGAVVGVLVVLQTAARLPAVGQAVFMGKLLVLLVLRELGPILVAIVVTARSGTAIVTELGIMSVRGEIDGLLGLGVDPLTYIVWPRVVGVATAVASLTVVFNLVAFVAGFGVASLASPTLNFVSLFDSLFDAMTLQDLLVSSIKSLTMGVCIAGIAAHQGLNAKDSTTDVPVRSLRAVVTSLIVCIIVELMVTVLLTDFASLTT